jgi:K+-sensing histidine kinase KdpD
MNSQVHPTTYRHSEMDHRRQKTWQIYIPIFAVIAIILATFILLLVSQNSSSGANIGNLSSISVIWLILPMLGIGFALLVILVGFIYLAFKITNVLPLYSLKISTIFYQVALSIHKLADKSVLPVIKIQQIQAGVNTLFHRNRK